MHSRSKYRKKEKQVDTLKDLFNDQVTTKWYTLSDSERVDIPFVGNDLVELENYSESLWRKDVDEYNQRETKSGSSEVSWLNTVLIRGTAADRASAVQVLVQKSPIHSLSHVEKLLNVAEKKNAREASSILGVLKNIFLNELLPPDRKLIPFSMRPIDKVERNVINKKDDARRLILWKFESDLKKFYAKYVNVLEKLTSGSVESMCLEACQMARDLLIAHPEQESLLLALLINKLGHPNNKVASKSSWHLLQICLKHPNMRLVIIKEVERLVYRKNIALRCQFHALSFLSQIRLRVGEDEISTSLLRIYFGLFKEFVVKKSMNEKILSLLLSATNRALPYAKNEAENLNKEVDTLYKLVHQSNFSTALQTLKLLYQLLSANQGMSDRFYATFYRKLFSIQGSSQESQLFSLLHRALEADIIESRVIAFIKRLLQLSLTRSAAFAAASLILVSKLSQVRPELLILNKVHEISDHELVIKKELDDAEEDENPFSQEIEPNNLNAVKKEEHDEEAGSADEEMVVSSWVHRKNIATRKNEFAYQPSVRNPLFSFADQCIVSELELLSCHYHPTVAVFASNLLAGVHIGYNSDPLLDFTQMRFLDRFVYRNPKDKPKKVSLAIHRKEYCPSGIKKLAVSSEDYMRKKRDEIPADERYLHRYVTSTRKIGDKEVSNEIQEETDWDEIESVNSEEFDLLLDKLEPGGKEKFFEVDFTKEFSAGKNKRFSGTKVKRSSPSSDLDDSMDDETENELDSFERDDDDDDDVDAYDDDELNDSSDMSELDENEDVDNSYTRHLPSRKTVQNDDLSDEMSIGMDAEASADQFGDMLESGTRPIRHKGKRSAGKSNGSKKRRFR